MTCALISGKWTDPYPIILFLIIIRSMTSVNEPESRLSIHEVPNKISRIFFGDPKPNYHNSGYNAPSAGNGYYYPPNSGGYNRDIDYELLNILGIIGLIAFIIFCIIGIIFMIFICCIYCKKFNNNTAPYYPTGKLFELG